jgi:K+-sensing histidine kinase KdpD
MKMVQHERDQADRLLIFVERLLAIESTEVSETLTQAALLVAEALEAEKADVFLYEQQSQSLVAQGISDTPLGHLQESIGMNRLQIANGGRTVSVFQTGIPYRSGQIEQDSEELPGVKYGMGIRSAMVVPLQVGEERRGAIQIDTTQPDRFTAQDQRFLESVAHWVGTVVHRAELLQQVAHSAAEQARRATAEELVTVLAHDLRNYLTPVQGRLGLLTRRATKEQRQRDLDDLSGITATMRRLERLITDLMDTTRLSQGLFTLAKELVDLAILAQETAIAVETPSVPIEVQTPPELIAWVDADRFRQALENILSNAVKHTPKGKTVLLQVETQEQKDSVLFSISDQGPGIPSELLSSLFEPFRAGASSTGLGLGLYLAQQIVQAHNGQLSVDTTYHSGARFRLCLPMSEGLSCIV